MKILIKSLTRPFVRFARDTNASVAVEAALILPILAAWFVGSFVFFDAFKSRNTALKATATIAEVISRRTEDVTPAYLDNLHELYETLALTDNSSALRVTMVKYEESKHEVVWSHSSSDTASGLESEFTNTSDFAQRIPIMVEGEQVILVETFQDYNPAFNIGLNHNVWENFIVTSPRYASQLGFAGQS